MLKDQNEDRTCYISDFNLEVIGNIYENSELLKTLKN